jgi:nitroreductase
LQPWFSPSAAGPLSFTIEKGAGKMIKGSEIRKADHPIDKLFLDRWSPRAMTGEKISRADLQLLFEAARWAPSSYNNQPWRILFAQRDTEHWELFFDLLVESNQVWAKNAAALILFISKTTFDYNGKPSITHTYDTGAAWENFALQGWLKGFVVHGMQGFDYERARTSLNIPEGFQVEAMAAVGIPASPDVLSEKQRRMESPSDRRKLEQTICEGPFCF